MTSDRSAERRAEARRLGHEAKGITHDSYCIPSHCLAAEAVELIERALLAAEDAVLDKALAVGSWTAEEGDGMLSAFDRAKSKHGMRETLFAVGAWLLRHRRERIK